MAAWRDNLGYVLHILAKTYAQFDRDRIPYVAAGATFFILLALFPAFASVVTLYGLFADRATIARELVWASSFLPRGAITVLDAELHRLIAQKAQHVGLTFAVSTLIALWSASGGFKALVDGLNVAYEVRETRGFFRLSLTALLLTGAAILFIAVAMALAGLLPLLLRLTPFHSILRALLLILSWPVAYGFSIVILAGVYSFGHNLQARRWQWLTWGSLLASGLWLLGTLLFKWYVQNFGNFDRVYGSLGAIVGFLTWIWLSLTVVLFGAELNCELERRRHPDVHRPNLFHRLTRGLR
jgi:membrane protein